MNNYNIGDNMVGSFLFCNFDQQKGYISITFRKADDYISNSSLIDTYSNTTHPINRPLGLYNDGSKKSI